MKKIWVLMVLFIPGVSAAFSQSECVDRNPGTNSCIYEDIPELPVMFGDEFFISVGISSYGDIDGINHLGSEFIGCRVIEEDIIDASGGEPNAKFSATYRLRMESSQCGIKISTQRFEGGLLNPTATWERDFTGTVLGRFPARGPDTLILSGSDGGGGITPYESKRICSNGPLMDNATVAGPGGYNQIFSPDNENCFNVLFGKAGTYTLSYEDEYLGVLEFQLLVERNVIESLLLYGGILAGMVILLVWFNKEKVGIVSTILLSVLMVVIATQIHFLSAAPEITVIFYVLLASALFIIIKTSSQVWNGNKDG